MDDETQQLIGLVHQLANAALVQARKLEELQKRIEKLEYERVTDAVGRAYNHDPHQASQFLAQIDVKA